MSYQATTNEDIVKDISEKEIDLSKIVDRYKELRDLYINTPKPKTTPDQETLDYYNERSNELISQIQAQALNVLEVIEPIKNAGLFPSKWDDEYQELVNFVNS